MSIGHKQRFRILNRDGFRCVYCGAKALAEHLQVDHIVPPGQGGTNDDDNLATSCIPCNQGKSNIPLGQHEFHYMRVEFGEPQNSQTFFVKLKAGEGPYAKIKSLIRPDVNRDFFSVGNCSERDWRKHQGV